MKRHGVVLMGQAGVGKSTVGQLLADLTGFKYVSTGALARELPNAEKWAEKGDMAPEQAIRKAFVNEIKDLELVIIDGMPRKPEQVEFLEKHFDRLDFYLLEAPILVLRDRLLERGRFDDTEEIIDARIAKYEELTMPAILKAAERHSVTIIDGYMKSPSQTASILAKYL